MNKIFPKQYLGLMYYFYKKLNIRIFEHSKSKTKEDRDIYAANDMIYFYLHNINAPGTDVNMLVDNKISYKEFVAKQESTTYLV